MNCNSIKTKLFIIHYNTFQTPPIIPSFAGPPHGAGGGGGTGGGGGRGGASLPRGKGEQKGAGCGVGEGWGAPQHRWVDALKRSLKCLNHFII